MMTPLGAAILWTARKRAAAAAQIRLCAWGIDRAGHGNGLRGNQLGVAVLGFMSVTRLAGDAHVIWVGLSLF